MQGILFFIFKRHAFIEYSVIKDIILFTRQTKKLKLN
jgi:hypothetical protein